MNRLAVYKALLESEEHPTPEMLYRKVRRSMPSLSLATIYKALDVLESLGLVRAIDIDSESRRYDANRNRHHHLVCRHCRKVVDFYDAALDQLRPENRIAGFVTESVSVNISGLCEKCRRSSAERHAGESEVFPRVARGGRWKYHRSGITGRRAKR